MQSKLEAKYLREIGEKVYSFFFENPEMGIYFIIDPDGYWIEIEPKR